MRIFNVGLISMVILAGSVFGGYKETTPREPAQGEIAVSAPGSYAEDGKTYILTKDITGPMTTLFLGKNVTLDLNGHTVTFADGNYGHVPNYGFEEGLARWDVSKAPGAKAVSTIVRPLVGKQFCLLPEGQEIVSEYVTLPVANRSYYGTCAVSKKNHRVTVVVEDESGKVVSCEFKGRSKPHLGGKIENIGPQLGGGTVFTQLFYLPAGKYRIRIKAVSGDCEIDECDIRPALDAGIAIVGAPEPYATYQDVMSWYPCAFFDYNKKDEPGKAVEGIPVIGKNEGTITIKNGTIRSGYVQGARSWGIQSNAGKINLILENLYINNSGLNSGSVQAAKVTIKNCKLEVDTPFIINRHDTSEMNAKIGEAVEISGNEFLGGQGCLSTRGGNADVHDNLFVNAQTVTNHYSISPGEGDKIYNNRFEPRIGSGIYIGSRNVEVYNNVFKISSAPANCEYRDGEYSTSALRISDYNTPMTGPEKKRVYNNKVYNNKIYITGKEYPEYDRYLPMTYAFFISVGGGVNQIYDNEIFVNSEGKKVRTLAFFIGGSDQGGDIYNNKITTNVTPVWIGTDYGPAKNVNFHNNTIIKAEGASDFKPFRLGDGENRTAEKIIFKDNIFKGCEFGITGQGEYTNK
ncbi:MAG: hypothetical protein A2231_13125 [Candidatus Firestonebacteria bacterium RIFOXYA2_FULL_40_8]|nr:MAG: hypothetical protein A2231_13125 [Candidatus Firestonebacteria bacterium RIFOXYA2_FULL_40_8]